MMPNVLLTLSDNDKRIIFSLLLIFVVVIVLIGLLGYILYRIMRWQSKKMDHLVHDVVVTKVITDKKAFIKYGRYKPKATKNTNINKTIVSIISIDDISISGRTGSGIS